MVADYSSKSLQGKLLLVRRNTMQGMTCMKDFAVHKGWHKEVLGKYDMWDEVETYLKDI